jgi:hypothetical protein
MSGGGGGAGRGPPPPPGGGGEWAGGGGLQTTPPPPDELRAVLPRRSDFAVAIAAIHRLVAAGLKWHLGGFATF